MDEPYSQPQPEDDGALLYWMWCQEQSEPDDVTIEPGDNEPNDPPPF